MKNCKDVNFFNVSLKQQTLSYLPTYLRNTVWFDEIIKNDFLAWSQLRWPYGTRTFFASVQLANERWETVEEEDRRCTCFWKRVVRRWRLVNFEVVNIFNVFVNVGRCYGYAWSNRGNLVAVTTYSRLIYYY